MGDRLLQIIKQTGIFMVCAQMILHFKPAECYEKYIRLLIGIMVLAQLIAAASALFGKEGKNFFSGRVDYYKALLAESMEGADMEKAEALLEQMTMEEVQARISQIREEQSAALQQGKTEGRQSGAVPDDSAGLQEPDEKQPVEEVDIQIERIEVKTGD